MRNDIERLVYDTEIQWEEIPMPLTRQELKSRLASRLLPRNSRAKTKVPVLPSTNSMENVSENTP